MSRFELEDAFPHLLVMWFVSGVCLLLQVVIAGVGSGEEMIEGMSNATSWYGYRPVFRPVDRVHTVRRCDNNRRDNGVWWWNGG